MVMGEVTGEVTGMFIGEVTVKDNGYCNRIYNQFFNHTNGNICLNCPLNVLFLNSF
jgi:hypothetical protein